MNTNTIKNRLIEKINTLSEEKLSSILSFIEGLENGSDQEETEEKSTVLERLGGVPENLIKGGGNLSDRDTRKNTIAQKMKQKYDR